jgi:hypothetical protein
MPRPMGLQNTCERAERNTQARGQAEEASGSATRGRLSRLHRARALVSGRLQSDRRDLDELPESQDDQELCAHGA